jgi:hypothetical protein
MGRFLVILSLCNAGANPGHLVFEIFPSLGRKELSPKKASTFETKPKIAPTAKNKLV